MPGLAIRSAGPDDAARLNAALRALSASMGDPHRASDAQIAAALAQGACRALLAEAGGQIGGAAVFSPLFSTTRGAAGVYVSDLWVAADRRGAGLGRRLLAAVRDEAARAWQAGFLRLGVYRDNAAARAFYDRLGFAAPENELYLTLTGAALAALEGDP